LPEEIEDGGVASDIGNKWLVNADSKRADNGPILQKGPTTGQNPKWANNGLGLTMSQNFKRAD
jgi:hypothetical protein